KITHISVGVNVPVINSFLNGTIRFIDMYTVIVATIVQTFAHFWKIMREFFSFQSCNGQLPNTGGIYYSPSFRQIVHGGKSSSMQPFSAPLTHGLGFNLLIR